MAAPRSPGLNNAQAAMQILAPDASGETRNLADMTAALDHLKGSQADWREAVAFLAAQYHAARRIGDAAASRDAHFAISQIRAQVARFDELHPSTPATGAIS